MKIMTLEDLVKTTEKMMSKGKKAVIEISDYDVDSCYVNIRHGNLQSFVVASTHSEIYQAMESKFCENVELVDVKGFNSGRLAIMLIGKLTIKFTSRTNQGMNFISSLRK